MGASLELACKIPQAGSLNVNVGGRHVTDAFHRFLCTRQEVEVPHP